MNITILAILVKLSICILVADFVSGFFHWLEDAYGGEDWPVTGKFITQPNILHHHNPGYFTRHSWFKSADVLLVMGAFILAAAFLIGVLNWMVIVVVGIGVNANEMHKWAHQGRKENGLLVTFLQEKGIIQSSLHHSHHHRGGKNTHYCVVTNYLNPVLDAAGFWNLLETMIFRVTGVSHRVDHSLGRDA